MRPEADHILMGLAAHLGNAIAADLEGTYGGGSIGTIALTMQFAAQEYDRAADIRLNENNALRALFAEAAPYASGDLAEALHTASQEEDTSLRISALNETNATLKTLLIALQEAVENDDTPQAKDLNRRIWDMLAAFTEARAFVIPSP